MIRKYLSGKDLPFWLLTCSVLILLTVPKLIQDGMFLDAMFYTGVSHNLAHGIGTFWEPVFSASYQNAGSVFFHEQPPLVFGILSLFFRLFGDSMYVERLYTFLTMCITAFSIKVLWDTVFRDEAEVKALSWLPLIFWIINSTCLWSYSNNMLENTMGIFTMGAVIFSYRAVDSGKNEIWLLILSGLFVFLATLSKGLPGLFPVAVPFLFWIVFRKKSFLKSIFQTLVIIFVPVILYFILYNIPESHDSLNFYFTKRLLARIHDDPTVGNRFYIIKRLFTELLPQILLTVSIISITKFRKINVPLAGFPYRSLFFFLTGLAAAAPLAITMVQRGFYLVPSFPCFALGFSILIAPSVLTFREKIISNPRKFRIYRIMSIILFVFAISFSLMQIGKTQRDNDMLHDVYAIGKTIPAKSEISVSQDIANNYVFECYFIRYYFISLFVDEQKDYLMVSKTGNPVVPAGYEKLTTDTRVYDIFKRKGTN